MISAKEALIKTDDNIMKDIIENINHAINNNHYQCICRVENNRKRIKELLTKYGYEFETEGESYISEFLTIKWEEKKPKKEDFISW